MVEIPVVVLVLLLIGLVVLGFCLFSRRSSAAHFRWEVETRSDGITVSVYLRRRADKEDDEQSLYLGDVSPSVEGDWSQKLNDLLVHANDKVGLLNAHLPGPSAG